MGGAQSSTKNTELIQRECVLDCNHATTIACHFSLQKLPAQKKQTLVLEYIFSTRNFWINTLKTLNAGYKPHTFILLHLQQPGKTSKSSTTTIAMALYCYSTSLTSDDDKGMYYVSACACPKNLVKSFQMISLCGNCFTQKDLVGNLLNWTKTNQLTLCYISMTLQFCTWKTSAFQWNKLKHLRLLVFFTTQSLPWYRSLSPTYLH